MTVGLVIFSRMDSQRLPGKALIPIGGRALLGHVIDRAVSTLNADTVIVATSDRDTDDAIAAFAEAQGVKVFRGSADDVLGRAVACAETFGLTVLGRICGDSPFISPQMLGRLLLVHKTEGPEFTTNVSPPSYPAGMTFEVMSIDTLRRLDGLVDNDEAGHREHMTSFIYENPDQFRIYNVDSGPGFDGWDGIPLTVDSADDLVQANWLFGRLKETGQEMTIASVLTLAREWRQTNPVEQKDKVL